MRAYKLMRKLKDGTLHSLFIDKGESRPIGKWMAAEFYPTKGFAERFGWHCCFKPIAPHLKRELANGEKRVWVMVDVEDYETYDRPESQGGSWILADKMKIVREISDEEVAFLVG